MRWRYWIVLSASFFVVACGNAEGASLPAATTSSTEAAPDSPTSAATSVASSAATPAPAASTGPGEVLAVWTRSGGFAGRTESMTVGHDGTITLEREGATQTAQVDVVKIRALEQLFAGADWTALDPVYGAASPDAFAYVVQAGGKSVTTYDGVRNPAILDKALQQLGDLYSAVPLDG